MEEILEKKIDVYIKIDEQNNIIDINSEIFIDNFEGWIKIDSGLGDRYAHAQSMYLPKQIMNEVFSYNYQYVNGKIIDKGSK